MAIRQPGITRFDGVTVEALQTTASQRYLVLSDGRQLQTPLVVAADGARSTLREMTDIDIHAEDMEHSAVVTTVRCEKSHGNTARQVFVGGQPLAFLPLTVGDDDHYCSIVWSVPPDKASELCSLTADALGEALEEAFEQRLGRVEVRDSVTSFSTICPSTATPAWSAEKWISPLPSLSQTCMAEYGVTRPSCMAGQACK